MCPSPDSGAGSRASVGSRRANGVAVNQKLQKGLLPVLAGTLLGFCLALGGAVLAGFDATSRLTPRLPEPEAAILAEVLEKVKREYVEPVSDHQLMDNAVRGMLAELDPHSQFLNAGEYEEIRISTSGNYSGVGLEVEMIDGRLGIVAAMDGTPAAQAGIRSGDVILAIDGEAVAEGGVSQAIRRMRGAPGTAVRLTVTREGQPPPLTFDLIRSSVEVHSVRFRLEESGYGYVRITRFSDTTARDVRRALSRLRQEARGDLRGLVLDLRNNPGGVLEAAVEVADLFLDDGVIVTASGRTPDATFRHEALPGDLLDGAPIAVLVNASSASAAEIVAGALQENARATLVGSRTFGKGSVQTVMPLAGGQAIKLTTSRYFTPTGGSIQGQGISPDVDLEQAGLPPAGSDPVLQRALMILMSPPRLQGRAH